jgi:hypothetical protein
MRKAYEGTALEDARSPRPYVVFHSATDSLLALPVALLKYKADKRWVNNYRT